MALNSLKDVYVDQLQDIYSACKQSIDATVALGEASKSKTLGEALAAGSAGIAEGMAHIERIASDHGFDPTAEFCKGMEGLVKEAHAHALNADFGSDEARDATIITQYLRMVHYALAGYGITLVYANKLGLDGDAALLKQCLDRTQGGHDSMMGIAREDVGAA